MRNLSHSGTEEEAANYTVMITCGIQKGWDVEFEQGGMHE